jgi:membrane protease YdiL (CAAX protease family)
VFANIFQAIIFAAIHLTTPMTSNFWLFIVLTLLLGLLWGYLTQKYKSLMPAIVLHVVADIFVAISLF